MRKNINSYLVCSAICIFMMAALSSCVKSREGRTDFDDLQPIVMIRESGLAQFSKQALTFPADHEADTVYFRVNYAAKDVAPTDITVTLGYDENALTAYNSTVDAASQYEKMPDSIYSFTSATATVKAGQSFSDPIPFVVYPSKVDPSKNYMFPITITNANGINVSGNFGTLYYHLIGNPLAGTYLQSFYRWNDADTTGPPNSTVFEDQPTTIAATSPTTLIFPESYLETFTGSGYALSFNSSLTSFSLELQDADAVANGGFTVVTAPTIISSTVVGDAGTGYAGTRFEFYMEVVNSSGGHRKLIDIFTKQ